MTLNEGYHGGGAGNWSIWNSTRRDDERREVDDPGLSERRAVLDLVQTVAFKLLVPPIVAFGCIGNIINIVVLTRKSMKSSTNRYLTCLAVYDILYLVFAFSMILKHYDDIGQPTFAAAFYVIRQRRKHHWLSKHRRFKTRLDKFWSNQDVL